MWDNLLPELREELAATEASASALSRLRARCRRESVQVFAFDPQWGRATKLFEDLARALRAAAGEPRAPRRPSV